VEHEHGWSFEAGVADTRAAVTLLAEDVADLRSEFRQDIRRLDDRIFQTLVIQLTTLATALGSLITALFTATR
jgi:hypothetical protein